MGKNTLSYDVTLLTLQPSHGRSKCVHARVPTHQRCAAASEKCATFTARRKTKTIANTNKTIKTKQLNKKFVVTIGTKWWKQKTIKSVLVRTKTSKYRAMTAGSGPHLLGILYLTVAALLLSVQMCSRSKRLYHGHLRNHGSCKTRFRSGVRVFLICSD